MMILNDVLKKKKINSISNQFNFNSKFYHHFTKGKNIL